MSKLNEQENEPLRKLAAYAAELGVGDKFNITLNHRHFEISDDEVMHEINDPLGRILIVRPIKKDQLPHSAKPTAWTLGPGQELLVETWCCDDITR